MLVETYEVIARTPDKGDSALLDELRSGEAIELIQSLGLEGQEELLAEVKEGEVEVVERNPYRPMTEEEQRVYGTLMPKRTKLRSYGSSAMPLRILQVAAHAVPLFESVEVWHPAEAKDDPLLVGVMKGKASQFNGWTGNVLYILARWGDVLLPFEELRRLAKEKLVIELRRKVETRRVEAEQATAMLESLVDSHLHGEYVPQMSW